jgi:hypothetical protein
MRRLQTIVAAYFPDLGFEGARNHMKNEVIEPLLSNSLEMAGHFLADSQILITFSIRIANQAHPLWKEIDIVLAFSIDSLILPLS